MAAAAHNPKFAKEAGISQKVAKEFNDADTGKRRPGRGAVSHKGIDSLHKEFQRREK